jgi:putative membrane protein
MQGNQEHQPQHERNRTPPLRGRGTSVKRFLLGLSINIIAILAAVWIVPGVDLQGSWWEPAVVALLFGLINTGIRPLLLLLTLPFVIVTLGFFMLVINAMVLYLTSWLAQGFNIDFRIDSLGAAIVGALVISLISTGLRLLSGDTRLQVQVHRGPPQ